MRARSVTSRCRNLPSFLRVVCSVCYFDRLLALTCECRKDGGISIAPCLESKGCVVVVVPETFVGVRLEIRSSTAILGILVAMNAL
jgi:hypothetical protein